MSAYGVTIRMRFFSTKLCEGLSSWMERQPDQLKQSLKKDLGGDLKYNDFDAILISIKKNWSAIVAISKYDNNVVKSISTLQELSSYFVDSNIGYMTRISIIRYIDAMIVVCKTFSIQVIQIEELEKMKDNVQHDSDIPEIENDIENPEEPIVVGTLVYISGDKNKKGVVQKIKGITYYVYDGTETKHFFRRQLTPIIDDAEIPKLSLSKVKVALTSDQITHPNNNNLYSLNAAKITFVPYQFRPALKMIKSDVQRILVADDVGVGKTIEAGLILKELEARSTIESVLIICPRPLVAEKKWELEMKNKFEEEFMSLNGEELREAIDTTYTETKWPERYKKIIIPYSLFNEAILNGTTVDGKKVKAGLNDLNPKPHFDLVIVDEAHTIRNPETYAHKVVKEFCENADAVVFLTATPLQNKDWDLYYLLNILRPDIIFTRSEFQQRAEPNRYINILLNKVRNGSAGWVSDSIQALNDIKDTIWGREVVSKNPAFARVEKQLEKGSLTKEEKISLISDIESLHTFSNIINRTRRCDIEKICVRNSQTVRTYFTDEQKSIYDLMMKHQENYLTMLHGMANLFMMYTVMRQAASCIYGLMPLIKDLIMRHSEALGSPVDEIAIESGEEIDSSGCDLESLHKLYNELKLKSLGKDDPKFNELLKIVRSKQNEENNRLIVFSSFRHTLTYLCKRLKAEGIRVEIVNGSTKDEERMQLRERFMAPREEIDAIDVLLFSEVGCEGLDYQFCDSMVNYDLPWNPMRIEQRIGRIDRHGQQSEKVRIINMITDGTVDATVFEKCLSKIDVFKNNIGDCGEILGNIESKLMAIMFNPKLTEAERLEQIERETENGIGRLKEMYKLENDEKSFYGIDLSENLQKKAVRDAENIFIEPECIEQLLESYLCDLLGNKTYIKGKEQKKLVLSKDDRNKLYLELIDHNFRNNGVYKDLVTKLRSNESWFDIAFDRESAANNMDAMYLTPMHPLIKMAAEYENQKLDLPRMVCFSINTDIVSEGVYPFEIYSWTYLGVKDDIKTKIVCDNEIIERNIVKFIQDGSECEMPDIDDSVWDEFENKHHGLWSMQNEEFKREVEKECEFRRSQLFQSMSRRKQVLLDEMKGIDDEFALKMKQGKIDKYERDYQSMADKLNEILKHRDIHADLKIRGVVVVRNIVDEGDNNND